MTTYLGKSCSFGLPRVSRKLPSIYVFSYFPFGFEGRMLDLIVSVLDHCLSFYFVSSKIYDKRDDFDLYIVNFPFLDGDVPRSTSYRVIISQLIRFPRVSSHLTDFNARNKSLTAKLLQQGY